MWYDRYTFSVYCIWLKNLTIYIWTGLCCNKLTIYIYYYFYPCLFLQSFVRKFLLCIFIRALFCRVCEKLSTNPVFWGILNIYEEILNSIINNRRFKRGVQVFTLHNYILCTERKRVHQGHKGLNSKVFDKGRGSTFSIVIIFFSIIIG